MKKEDFAAHTRYTVTWKDPEGKLRPANIYVYKLYDGFMIARMTDKAGQLRKFGYDEIVKIVKAHPIPATDQFHIPEGILKEKVWATRTTMERYSSAPNFGK